MPSIVPGHERGARSLRQRRGSDRLAGETQRAVAIVVLPVGRLVVVLPQLDAGAQQLAILAVGARKPRILGACSFERRPARDECRDLLVAMAAAAALELLSSANASSRRSRSRGCAVATGARALAPSGQRRIPRAPRRRVRCRAGGRATLARLRPRNRQGLRADPARRAATLGISAWKLPSTCVSWTAPDSPALPGAEDNAGLAPPAEAVQSGGRIAEAEACLGTHEPERMRWAG